MHMAIFQMKRKTTCDEITIPPKEKERQVGLFKNLPVVHIFPECNLDPLCHRPVLVTNHGALLLPIPRCEEAKTSFMSPRWLLHHHKVPQVEW